MRGALVEVESHASGTCRGGRPARVAPSASDRKPPAPTIDLGQASVAREKGVDRVDAYQTAHLRSGVDLVRRHRAMVLAERKRKVLDASLAAAKAELLALRLPVGRGRRQLTSETDVIKAI